MSASKILTFLTGSAALNAEVSDRVELVPVSKGLTPPHISYEYSGHEAVYDLSGRAPIEQQDWDFYVTAQSFIDAERIKGILIAELSGETTSFRARETGSNYAFDADTDLHQFTINVRITY